MVRKNQTDAFFETRGKSIVVAIARDLCTILGC